MYVVLKTEFHGCVKVAWDLCWGGTRSAKHYAFSGKVAAAGNAGQLVCVCVCVCVYVNMCICQMCICVYVYLCICRMCICVYV